MDRADDKRNEELDGYTSSEGQQETSFVTAEVHSYQNPDEPIRSSRTMPVPEFLNKRTLHGSRENISKREEEGPEEDPPPAYEEAVADTRPPQNCEAGAEADGLTPDEISVIMSDRENLNMIEHGDGAIGGDAADTSVDNAYQKRQKDRSSYLPSERQGSYEEAVEMIPAENGKGAQDTGEAVDSTPRILSMNIEEGQQANKDDYKCVSCGPLNYPMTSFCRCLRRQSTTRLVLFSMLIIGILGLLLFVSLFPASFVYINYHEIALRQSKLTNVVDRDTVYYPGCYVLGPNSRLILFTASVHNVVEEVDVFTLDTIPITIKYSTHYFVRPSEIGQLYSMFLQDYDYVLTLIIRSSLRNLAGETLTVDNFRFNRTYVETQMHNTLRKRLGGDCCPDCCRDRTCQSNTYCEQCKPAPCDQGYHVDVRYFNLLSVSIPNEVFERMLFRTLLEVQKEREFFIQDHAVTKKETERITRKIKNQANEKIKASQFEADKIETIAEADKEKAVQVSYTTALKGIFSRLNVTDEDHKLSLMMIRALEDMDNLYTGFGYDESILFAP